VRILVTGARGKVGAAAVDRLLRAGHDVTAVDSAPAVYERARQVIYVQADLSDAGHAAAVVPGHDAVVHAAAIASPVHNPEHVIFQNNLLATYNTLQAAERAGVRRFVHLSSETVPGFSYPKRYFHAEYAPIDEAHPVRPQDSYALSKWFGELLMDSAVQRSDLAAISIRPTWIQWEGNIERNVGPIVRARGTDKSASFWSYILVDDLTELILAAATTELPGHEVFYAAGPDNAAGGPLHELIQHHFGDLVALRPVERPDASGISCAKARRILDWSPKLSWRDWLDEDGHAWPEIQLRVEAGDTSVQRGLRATS
jgi:nucleoside-diphosphate-sugar epimerase